MFISKSFPSSVWVAFFLVLTGLGLTLSTSCGSGKPVSATNNAAPADPVSVAVAPATQKTLEQHLTLSSELVPYQEIDVFAKESGFVKKLNVDYGSHVKAGDIMAVLEIPELEAQLQQDADKRPARWIWVHHAPPANSQTSWGGKRFFGDVELVQWIARYQPSMVISGHVHQSPFIADGSWFDRRICPHYATAMACIILQIPNNYLPIFQR